MDIAVVIVEVLFLVLFSSICSGLNIAVMALDSSELRRKAKLGNKQAKRVLPLRQRTHLTLASILLVNVAAVSATSLVLEQRLNGWLAGMIGTLLIVIFGEIMPQALFSRNPLAWTSRFAPLLKLMIGVTYIISRPLQLLLDDLFPREHPQLQSRRELGLMIAEHMGTPESELDDDEVEIIRGALQLSEKRVRDIMTDIQHTYWVTPSTKLTDEKIDEIKEQGFSRIPVFNARLTRTYGILLMKDLVDIDFDHHNYQVDDLTLHPVQLVGSMTALDTMFRKFIATGTHLIPIERDDEIVGVLTIEDLIEEIVGHEIEDETDRRRPLRAGRH
jgi:CBS domain containing-hemolysin-like protein